ncbi:MAG: efflux RND transporter periplasmic adaptor subunit [Planctomycetota bacterium]
MNAPRCVVIALTVVGALGWFASRAQAQGGPPPALVVLDEVRSEYIEGKRRVTGELTALRRTVVSAENEGPIRTMSLDAGDAVQAGDVIAQLDTELAEIAVRSWKAELDAAVAVVGQRRAELDDAELDLKRVEELRARDSASPSEFDQARLRVDGARAAYAEAEALQLEREARVAEAQSQLEDLTVVAPFDGVIVRKQAEIGQWVALGDPVVELVSMDELEARLEVPESILPRLSNPDVTVRLYVQALSEWIEAPVTAIVPDVDPLSRLAPVRVVLDNPSGVLRPGMSVYAEVPTGAPRDVLTVHKDAILRNDAGEIAYYAQEGEMGLQAAVVPIVRLYAVGEQRVAVRPVGPMRAGLQLVIEGNERVFPTQPLNPMPKRPAEESGTANAAKSQEG